LRVTCKATDAAPLDTVTESVTTDVVLFGANVAVITLLPPPDEGVMVWINELPVAVQLHASGVVVRFQLIEVVS
jgi:hypothetical protein